MPKSILDPAFQYTPSTRSDIRMTFWRHQKAMEAGAIEYDSWIFDKQAEASNVQTIPNRRKQA